MDTDWTLGKELDGCKIHGYWYAETVNFLYACADAMIGLTEDRWANQIEMTEEGGFKIWIKFYLEKGKPIVSVDYVPMETKTMFLTREGKITD